MGGALEPWGERLPHGGGHRHPADGGKLPSPAAQGNSQLFRFRGRFRAESFESDPLSRLRRERGPDKCRAGTARRHLTAAGSARPTLRWASPPRESASWKRSPGWTSPRLHPLPCLAAAHATSFVAALARASVVTIRSWFSLKWHGFSTRVYAWKTRVANPCHGHAFQTEPLPTIPYDCPARTGFANRPTRSISTTTVSPSFRYGGGVRPSATPAGVPVRITWPGRSVIVLLSDSISRATG